MKIVFAKMKIVFAKFENLLMKLLKQSHLPTATI